MWRTVVVTWVAVAVIAGCAGNVDNPVTVNSLWYGSEPGQQGVTQVAIDAKQTSQADPFTVDLSGFQDADTDPVWNASGWTAATLAVLMVGGDPRGTQLSFDVSESIGGPSAGALTAAGSIAALQKVSARTDFAATGTALPDGTVGPVSGIPDKIRAAKAAGITTVAYPRAAKVSTDRTTGQAVDVESFARSQNVTAIPVASVADVAKLLSPNAPQPPTSEPGEINESLVQVIRGATARAVQRIGAAGWRNKLNALPTAQQQSLEKVASAAVVRARAISGGAGQSARAVFDAFSAVTLVERAVLRSSAANSARVSASRDRAATTAELRAQAERLAADAQANQRRFAHASSVVSLEQIATLPDALSWASDAYSTAQATLAVLAKPLTVDQIGQQAADLAQVRYDLDIYLPTAVAAAESIDTTKIKDMSTSQAVLVSYARLLLEAGSANQSYVSQRWAQDSNDVVETSQQLSAVLRERANSLIDAAGQSLPDALIAAADALSFYTQTVAAAAAVDVFREGSGDDPALRVDIADEALFAEQLASATAQSAQQSRLLAGADLDSSYLRWGADWGRAAAAAPIADTDRREGLVYIWYATTAGRMLMSLQAVQAGN